MIKAYQQVRQHPLPELMFTDKSLCFFDFYIYIAAASEVTEEIFPCTDQHQFETMINLVISLSDHDAVLNNCYVLTCH